MHRHGRVPAMQDVESDGLISLAEEDTILGAIDGPGPFPERPNQLLIANKS
jgi:hypothetical protein